MEFLLGVLIVCLTILVTLSLFVIWILWEYWKVTRPPSIPTPKLVPAKLLLDDYKRYKCRRFEAPDFSHSDIMVQLNHYQLDKTIGTVYWCINGDEMGYVPLLCIDFGDFEPEYGEYSLKERYIFNHRKSR